MLTDLALTILGIAVLLGGGELMVKGAAALAKRLGISSLAVGLTVVAFGTSAPELAVSLKATLTGSGNLAFGNIFGSNLANIGLIVGIAAMVRPLPIDNMVVRRELPMMLLAVAAAIIMTLDPYFGETKQQFSHTDGLLLLLFFVVFLYYTIGDMLNQRNNGNGNGNGSAAGDDATPRLGNEQDVPHADRAAKIRMALRDLLFVVVGLAGLLLGAQLTVTGGTAIAITMGVPEVIIGLTLVSVGTSLPELVAALSAMRQDEMDIAVGGVVGSNIFNILLVCGLTSAIHPIPIPAGGQLDMAITAVLSLMLLFTARTHSQKILRYEGLTLLVIYLGYISYRSIQMGAHP
jgi:cation:H+ antiporter